MFHTEDMMDIKILLKLKSMGEKFTKAHPKFVPFLKAAGKCADAGTTVEITVTTSEGRKLESNLRLSAEDIQTLKELSKAL